MKKNKKGGCMRSSVLILCSIIVAAACFVNKAYAEEHKYIGASKCKMCHSSDAKGNQYKVWAESKHAKAYETLATEEAKKAAEKAGLKTDPQKSPECLKCHVTAFGAKDDLKEASFNAADGVQCESCHGAGSDYKGLSVMKDKQQAIAEGLVIPNKEICVKCHNPESPNFKEFDYDKFYPKIAHPRPKG